MIDTITNPSSQSELRSSWLFPSFYSFSNSFRNIVGLPPFNLNELEEAIISPHSSPLIAEIFYKLLTGEKSKPRNFLSFTNNPSEQWENLLKQKIRIYNIENTLLDTFLLDFQDFHWKDISVTQKLLLLEFASLYRLELANEDINKEFKSNELVNNLRIRPIGTDSQGRTYWHFSDDSWIFRENNTLDYYESDSESSDEYSEFEQLETDNYENEVQQIEEMFTPTGRVRRQAALVANLRFREQQNTTLYRQPDQLVPKRKKPKSKKIKKIKHNPNPSWEVICSTLGEIKDLMEQLGSSKNANEKKLFKKLKYIIYPHIEQTAIAHEKSIARKLRLELMPRKRSERLSEIEIKKLQEEELRKKFERENRLKLEQEEFERIAKNRENRLKRREALLIEEEKTLQLLALEKTQNDRRKRMEEREEKQIFNEIQLEKDKILDTIEDDGTLKIIIPCGRKFIREYQSIKKIKEEKKYRRMLKRKEKLLKQQQQQQQQMLDNPLNLTSQALINPSQISDMGTISAHNFFPTPQPKNFSFSYYPLISNPFIPSSSSSNTTSIYIANPSPSINQSSTSYPLTSSHIPLPSPSIPSYSNQPQSYLPKTLSSTTPSNSSSLQSSLYTTQPPPSNNQSSLSSTSSHPSTNNNSIPPNLSHSLYLSNPNNIINSPNNNIFINNPSTNNSSNSNISMTPSHFNPNVPISPFSFSNQQTLVNDPRNPFCPYMYIIPNNN